jgi:hypothetical protein
MNMELILILIGWLALAGAVAAIRPGVMAPTPRAEKVIA